MATTKRSKLLWVRTYVPIAVIVLGFPAMLAVVLLAVQLIQKNDVAGQVLMIGVIAVVGAWGGVLSAARDGTLKLLRIDDAGDIVLGFLQDVAFGCVGGLVLFLIVPSASGHALKLGKKCFEEATLVSTVGEKPEAKQAEKVATVEASVPAQLDWIEVIAMAIVGGYGGRALLSKALSGYVTEDQLERSERSVTGKIDELRTDQVADQNAINLYYDQVDIYTSPPDRTALTKAIESASPLIHEMIYVQTRARAHLYLMMAAQMAKPVERERFQARIAERVIAIMEILRNLDPQQKYRGSRFFLALGRYLQGDWEIAQEYLNEAEEISLQRHQGQPLDWQYELLSEQLASKKPCDVDFLWKIVQQRDVQ